MEGNAYNIKYILVNPVFHVGTATSFDVCREWGAGNTLSKTLFLVKGGSEGLDVGLTAQS